MQDVSFIFEIAVLVFSVVIHEVSHGYSAELLGDPTARLAGRLTLNPMRHLDPFGSVILPGFLALTNSAILFGWARPVPYNPYNLRNAKWGPGIVALSGPLANIAIALLFVCIVRLGILEGSLLRMASLIIFMNLILAFFNLIPIPPLDGFKVLSSVAPYRYYRYFSSLEEFSFRYGLIFLVVALFIFWKYIAPIFSLFISFLFDLLTGYPITTII